VLAFQKGLLERGLNVGQNVRIDYRFGVASVESISTAVADILATSPEVSWLTHSCYGGSPKTDADRSGRIHGGVGSCGQRLHPEFRASRRHLFIVVPSRSR
jgi:hypothetical protein